MNHTKTIPLELVYKGTRDYLHGTDMYDAIMEQLRSAVPQHAHGAVKMVMHGFARHQCDLMYMLGQARCPKPVDARVEFFLGDIVSGWLTETARPVLSRRPYKEDELVASSRIDGHSIIAGVVVPCSVIEILVALTKRLHTVLRPDQAKWAFTRLELQRPLADDDAGRLQVELLQSLGNRLTKSAVRTESMALGHIYFSAVTS